MGDRAVVVFTSGQNDYSPGIYVHWAGHDIPEMITESAPALRKGDPNYSAARFCGVLHSKLPGVTGLGLVPPPSAADIKNKFAEYSHGDAGVFVVNVTTGAVKKFAGYKAKRIALDMSKVPE